MAPATTSCHTCGKSAGKLLLCGRCRNARFCNRECQRLSYQLGHRGANCHPAAGVQQSAAPSQPPTPTDAARLYQSYKDLIAEAKAASDANTRVGFLTAVDTFRAAGSVADLIGGVHGAGLRADTDQVLADTLFRLGDLAAAALAARSSLRSARASGSRTMLVAALQSCGMVALSAPGEMASAERESR